MNITIDKSIFDALDTDKASVDDISYLTTIAKRRGYTVSISPSIGANELGKLDILKRLALTFLINDGYNHQPEPHNSDCIVMVNGEAELNERIFSLAEACVFVDTTAIILMENDANDGLFIRAVERFFESQFDFEYLLMHNVVDIRHSGGSDCKSRVDYLLSKYKGVPKFLRCLAIVDGDKRYPADNTFENYPKQNENNIRSDAYYLKQHGVGYYVLKKRSLENYLPDEIYDNNRQSFGDEWVDAYLSLKPVQKDYYYIAEGFSKDISKANRDNGDIRFENLPQGVKNLFHDVSPGNYQHLLHGPNLHGSFKSEFPKFFSDPHVCKTALQNRVNHPQSADPDELMHIVEEIRQLL